MNASEAKQDLPSVGDRVLAAASFAADLSALLSQTNQRHWLAMVPQLFLGFLRLEREILAMDNPVMQAELENLAASLHRSYRRRAIASLDELQKLLVSRRLTYSRS